MLYIGLMSGTSLDGIDAALVDIDPMGYPRLINQHYHPYSEALQSFLFDLSQANNINLDAFAKIDQELGKLYGECCLDLLKKSQFTASDIHAIGSHGQTIRHKPRPHAFSLQIGDANQISEITGITTVADFRRRDIAAGGEGAPLVPAFHQHVFFDTQTPRQILNLGGIANITVLSQEVGNTFGFDLGPANALSNEWVEKHWGLNFDQDGKIAQTGQINNRLLDQWINLEFFNTPPPKSTGRELFNINTFETLTPEMLSLPKEDVLATFIELTAISISKGVQQWGYTEGDLFLCGGGTYNLYLINRIRLHLPNLNIKRTDELGIPSDMVEAVAFAWLAHRTMNSLSGNLSNATGAKGERILGAIYPA